MTDPRIATLRETAERASVVGYTTMDGRVSEEQFNALADAYQKLGADTLAALVSLADELTKLRREERRWYEQFHTEMQRADAAEALAAVVALRDAARNLRCCAECEGDLGRWEKFDDALALFPAGTDSTEEQP